MCYHYSLERTGPVFCLLTGVPLGSLPSCPGMVSAQLLEERPSNSPPVPAQLSVHLPAAMASPCQVFEPFLHQSKELASGGSEKGAACGREAAAVVTPCAVDPHTLQLVSQPWKEMS